MSRKRRRSPPRPSGRGPRAPPPPKMSTGERRYLSANDVLPDEQLEAVVEQYTPECGLTFMVSMPEHRRGYQLTLQQDDIAATYGALTPKASDRIRLTASFYNSTATNLANCKLLSLTSRDSAEWLSFARRLLNIAENSPRGASGHLLAELGEPNVVWPALLLGDFNDSQLSGAVCRLLTRLTRLLSSRKRENLQIVIELASSQKALSRLLLPLVAADAAQSPDAPMSHRRIVVEFARSLLAQDPGCLARLLPLLKGATAPSNSLLLDLLTAVAELRPGGRRSISIAPTSEEVSAGRKSMLTGLQPARIQGPYQSVEDYFETMFRLLRADCFEKFYECMEQVKSGSEIRNEDIRVYCNVKVKSVKLSKSGSCSIGVTFELRDSDHAPSNWAKSMRLMTGNLLCLATSERFSEQYWATVADRDSQDLNSSRLVWLDLCQYMCSPDTSAGDVLVSLMLNSTRASNGLVMLESPTMFRAFEPVLESLKCFDAERFPFADSLVFGDMTAADAQPLYVKRHYEGDPDDVDYCAENLPFISTGSLKLDVCQTSAFENALHRRIYVCQGPPGTGKTLLGVLIARQLLELDVLKDRPILVLCYKNHALDEFLSHLLPEHQEDIVRIGGRCKDLRLEHLNLIELRRKYPDRGRAKSLRTISSEIEEAWAKFKDSVKELDCLFSHPAVAIMDECNETYLAELVRYRNRKSSIKQMTPEELEVEEKFKRASKDELHDLIRSDAKVLAALAACVDRSMPAIKDQLEANRKKAQKISVHTNIPAAPSCSNSSSQPAKTVAKASLDDAEEEEVKERENQILASLASKDSQTERGGKSNLIDRINLDNTNGSQILHDPGIENCCNSGVIAQLSRRNPTRLSPTEQLLYFQQALYKAISKIRSDIKEQFDTIQRLESEKRLLEVKADASILRRRRIIGMTITGASIHRELLDLVQPGVLLVEEAAEVSEPHLLACFGHRTEQLILIGDHKQLRPQTESYKLAKDYHLDVSMMERLIANGIKYDQLELQSRMKPELSILLRDIYPNLRDNLEVVSRDLQPRCFTVPTFFWTHRELESTSGGHGATNMEEAQRCVRLAMFLILQGCDPDRITILSAYRRQTSLIRNLLKDFLAKSDFLRILIQHRSKRNWEDLELTESPTEQSNTVVTEADLSVKIFTIDLYQGDENDIVIVSLVRSNPSNNIGFLKTLNRRCVAQSRARLAMVFIGNADCIYDSPNGKVWRPLIDAMKGSNCMGAKISLRCPNHAQSVVQSESFDQIPTMSPFCLEVCGIQMSCGIHSCLLPCQPPHDQEHDNCKVVVPFVHPLCNHNDTKFCSEPIGVKTCKTKVSMKFTECSHEILKECGMPDSFYKCHEKCERLLNCGHKCLLKCFELCSSRPCKEKVPHRFPCGHTINTQCCENRDVMTCQQPCSRKLPCNHPCTLKCGEDCKLKPCFVQTTVKYPNCEHSIKVPCCMSDQQFVCDAKCERKLACGHSCPGTCSADCASIACQVKIKLILPCAHPAEIECSIPESQVKCKKICNKQLEGCGHKCLLQCYQPCNSEKCKVCASIQSEIEKKQLLELQQAIRRNAFEELKKIRAMKDLPSSVKTISCDGDYCDEYLDVHDRVMKFIQSEHGWHPAITKIEKIENSKLTLQFLDFKAKCAADPRRSEKKFHGTSANALHSIVTDGFKLPSKAGMYGPGIYFATNSSKSSQQIYTKGSNMLLLCEVLIGRTLKVTSATQMYKSHADLKKIGYDSLFAPRNTKSTGGVLFDEYVIFDPRQAVPQYVIHYSNLAELPVMSLPPSAENHVLKIRPDRYKTDSDSCKALHFASVQSEYLRIDGTIKSLGSITEVWVNRNAQLEQNFKAKQEEFRNKYNSDCWVYAFHGTNRNSADQIFKENFRLDKCTRQAYGRGIYFSEFTHISKDYGDALLLCRVLPGREVDYPPPPNKPAEYDCVRVRDSSSDYSNMLVISNPDQILPVYRVFTTIKFTQ